MRPSFFLEGTYENTYNSADPSAVRTPVLRAQMYQPILSGQMGFFFGNSPLWFFGNPGDGNPGIQYEINQIGWGTALGSPGSRSATVASRFFSSINWHLLYPDSSRLLAPSGYGSYGSDSYALAALSSDRRLGVIYYTASQNVTVNLWTMAGPVQAQWFDPSTGNYTTISGSPFANSGTRTFTPPGSNGEGSSDWVLLLQSN